MSLLNPAAPVLIIWLIVARRLPGDRCEVEKSSHDLWSYCTLNAFFFYLTHGYIFKYSLHICNTLHLQKYFLGVHQKLLIENVLSVELSVHVCSYPQEGTM